MRYDGLLRTVMWLDAFLSVAFVAVGVVVTPVAAATRPPHGVMVALGYATLISALVLAACGAVTAVAIAARLRAGNFLLPRSLDLPLPSGMRPEPATFNPR